MRRKTIHCALLAILVLLLAVPAHADECSADCEGAGCTGGCDINSMTCRTSCIDDGCPDGVATCQEYGDSTECYHSFSSPCDPEGTTEDPPTGPESPSLTAPPIISAPDWAVLRYEALYLTPVHRDEVHTLAASSESFARGAADEVVQKSREQSEHRLSRRSAARDGETPWVPPSERLHFVVSPNAPCSDVTMELTPAAPAQPIRQVASVFVRAAVDADGKIRCSRGHRATPAAPLDDG